MTPSEALRATGGPYGFDQLPIRRRGWVDGLWIWSTIALQWQYRSADEPGPRALLTVPMQSCLTPETMLAEDWEVVGGEENNR